MSERIYQTENARALCPDINELQRRTQNGEEIDVVQEFAATASTISQGAKLFADTFSRVIGRSSDMETFGWRTSVAMNPKNIKKICNRIDISPRQTPWVPIYSNRLGVQLCRFAEDHPDDAANAGMIWGQELATLLGSSLVNPNVRNTIGRRAVRPLRREVDLGDTSAAVGAFVALRAMGIVSTDVANS